MRLQNSAILESQIVIMWYADCLGPRISADSIIVGYPLAQYQSGVYNIQHSTEFKSAGRISLHLYDKDFITRGETIC